MGAMPQQVPAMSQIALQVAPLHTIYTFEAAGISLRVTFFIPALPEDLDALSQPVTYLSWTIQSADNRQHSATILVDVDPGWP